MAATVEIFKALSDEVRLRLLRALWLAELSVAELVRVVEMPQSTVSRHLRSLRESRLVETRREGTSIYYRRGQVLQGTDLAGLLEVEWEQIPKKDEDEATVYRLLELRRRRSREFFDRIAGQYGRLTQPGGSWEALASALAVGFAGRDVADLGCGEGALTRLLARFARRVVAVDQAPGMLELVARESAGGCAGDRVNCVEGDMESLPIADADVDVAFLSQSLHHAARPNLAIQEAARILRPGGHAVVLDLARHEHEWVREERADQWLGFDEADLQQWMEDARLRVVCMERRAGFPAELAVLFMVGVKPNSVDEKREQGDTA